jgi:hypothetical protein
MVMQVRDCDNEAVRGRYFTMSAVSVVHADQREVLFFVPDCCLAAISGRFWADARKTNAAQLLAAG